MSYACLCIVSKLTLIRVHPQKANGNLKMGLFGGDSLLGNGIMVVVSFNFYRCLIIMWKISRFVAYFFGFGIGQAQLGDGNTKSTPNLQYPNSEPARLILPPQ